jgi:anthrone oxygenase-like protein
MRNVALFTALFFGGLVAGVAFVVWIEYRPVGMTPGVYTASMQHAIQVFTTPLPVVVMLSVLSSAAGAFFARRERSEFRLLLLATLCAIAVALITVLGNIPINNQIKSWDASAPPQGWADAAARWWAFQNARTAASVLGFVSLILAVMMRRREGPMTDGVN